MAIDNEMSGRITIRLPVEMVEVLDALVDQKNTELRRRFSSQYANRSTMLRELLDLGLQALKATEEVKKAA